MVIRPLTAHDIGTAEDVCRDDATAVWVADHKDRAVGFVAVRVGNGEIHMLAVDPERAGFTGFPQVQYCTRLAG